MTDQKNRFRKYYKLNPFDLIMTRQEIIENFEVSVRTISNWLNGSQSCVVYVYEKDKIRPIKINFEEISDSNKRNEQAFVNKWSNRK